mmetsp:Transcript_65157/g.184824  ORF Transcript_65157/g.184824 Transcript_65157/m.184824 type:complete len:262 (+) Transcript_65157:129-914(+)
MRTIGMWCRLMSTAQATADVSSTTFSSELWITVMPRAIRGTLSNKSLDSSASPSNCSWRSSKSTASRRHTRPVMGCTSAASCSFESRPRKESFGDRWVMHWMRDHLAEVSIMEMTMQARPRRCASPSSFVPSCFLPSARPCSAPPKASSAPAAIRSQVRLSRLHIQAVIMMKSTLMFWSIVFSDMERPSRDLLRKPISQPVMTPSSATCASSSKRARGNAWGLHLRCDRAQEMTPVVMLTSQVCVKLGSILWSVTLNMTFT